MRLVTIEEHVLNVPVAQASAATAADAVGFLLRADLPDGVREDIAHRNAERLMPGLA